MPSVADLALAVRDRDLKGLGALLDAEATTAVLGQAGALPQALARIEYRRYKPGRRCVNLARVSTPNGSQCYTITAFTESAFQRQQERASRDGSPHRSWLDPGRRLRVDAFPWDPTLRHVERCFDPPSRCRLLRRTLGREFNWEQLDLETLAYKPGKRFVAAGRPLGPRSDASPPPSHTLKFYARELFQPAWRSWRSLQAVDAPTPRVVAANPRYRILALEWLPGETLAELLGRGDADASVLFEAGAELARLHACPVPPDVSLGASHRDLRELAEHIDFLSPRLGRLAARLVAETRARLADMQSTRTLIHGDLCARQVLITERDVRLIDFDSAGLGERYQDLGNFVAKLHWQRMRLEMDGESFVERHADAFLRGYRHRNPDFVERSFRIQLAAGLIRCATHPFRHAHSDWEDCAYRLLMLARSALRSRMLAWGTP